MMSRALAGDATTRKVLMTKQYIAYLEQPTCISALLILDLLCGEGNVCFSLPVINIYLSISPASPEKSFKDDLDGGVPLR